MAKGKCKTRKKDALTVLQPNVAGIDVGSASHHVSVPVDRDEKPIREYGCFTRDLKALADWLQSCEIEEVVMESTSVYWIPLYEVLESQGFKVLLVNARHVKNVPGKKTDVQDCQWLRQLGSYGLLRGSFRPEEKICVLRSYVRQRDQHKQGATRHIQRMQKALTQMNVQLHKVISDITGETGQRIIQAILAGERDPTVLAQLRGKGIKHDEETIAKALEGTWREEHLFTLKQEYALYGMYVEKQKECDKAIKGCYATLQTKSGGQVKKKKRHKQGRRDPDFDLHEALCRVTGTDVTQIPGIDILSAQQVFSETELDMSAWPSEKHFTSWLGLCPANKISGNKVLSGQSRKVVNRASHAFRLAAFGAGKSQTWMGAHYRRLRSRMGSPKAVTATARKIACIFYRLVKYGEAYVDQGLGAYEERYRTRQVKYLKRKASGLGFKLVSEEAEMSLIAA